MLVYPQIDPVIVEIGPLALRWYGLMYTLAFLIGWPLLLRRAERWMPALTREAAGDLMIWILLGVVLGGRIGYALFYHGDFYLSHPLAVFKVWEGGMSFHGGLLGVLVAGFLFARNRRLKFFALADLVIPVVPIGLFLGRIGNFINGELWGRATDLPWGMVFPFPDAGMMPRHPSQLYEAFLEGALLFVFLWWLGRKKRPDGVLLGSFLVGYAAARFLVEFVREPDLHLGLLAGGLSLGQWLTLPMALAGVVLIQWAGKGAKASS